MSLAASSETSLAQTVQAIAIRVHAFGPPEAMVQETIDLPPPGEGDIMVRVHAAGVGPWDSWVRGGHSVLPQPLPLTPGSDVAGVVEQVGAGVTGFAVGDAVYGTTNRQFTNGYASHANCTAAMMAHKPQSLSFPEAAGVPVVAVTAWQMLFAHAGMTRGQSVLILGAGGSVGRFAVQFARGAGLDTLASVRSGGTDDMRALGADEVIGPLAESGPGLSKRVDAVIDLVGGEAQRLAMRAIRPGGVLISAVAPPDEEMAQDLGIGARFMPVDVNSRDLTQIAQQFDGGAIRAGVGTLLPLAEAVSAHRMIEGLQPHAPGKIVLLVA
jgi:NADPH:quinone reductase-like Zn-dependent oxidoreductase